MDGGHNPARDPEKQLPYPTGYSIRAEQDLSINTTSPWVDATEGNPNDEEAGDVTPVSPLDLSLQETRQEDYGRRPAYFKNTFEECLFVLTTAFAIAQTSLITGVTSVLSATIARDLSMSTAEVTWMSAGATLGAGSFLLFFGRVADLFGKRWLLLSSMFAYTLCCLISGFSNSPLFLDSFMGIVGITSAGSVPPSIGCLGTIYKRPSSRKNKAYACFSAGNPLGFVIGMLIAGISVKVANWRAAFWATSVIYLFFTVAAYFTMPKDETSRRPFNISTVKKFDCVGIFLSMAGIALFTSALSIAGDAQRGWASPYVIAMIVIGIALLVAFVVWEGIFEHPLMPLYIWRDKTFALLVLCLCLGFLGFSGISFWLCLYFQQVQRLEPLAIAVRMLPMAIVGISVNVVVGFIMSIVSNRLLMFIGSLAFTGCFALLTATPEHSSYWAFIFPALCLSVTGADLVFPVTNMYVVSAMPLEQQAIAGSLLQTLTRLVISLGLAIQTAAFSALSNSGGALTTEFHPFKGPWWVALAACGLGTLVVPFIKVGKQGQKIKEKVAH